MGVIGFMGRKQKGERESSKQAARFDMPKAQV